MKSSALKFRAYSFSALAFLAVAGFSHAEDAAPAAAPAPAKVTGCFAASNLSPADISAFVTNPTVLLQISDNFFLMTKARSLAGSSEDALVPLITLASTASHEQMAAIGAGLGRAANSCLKPNPQYKLKIEMTVAEMATKDPRLAPLLAAFARALNEDLTASLGTPGTARSSGASSIGNTGSLGMTWLGSDNGTGFEGVTNPEGTNGISRYGAGQSTVVTLSVSATAPVTP